MSSFIRWKPGTCEMRDQPNLNTPCTICLDTCLQGPVCAVFPCGHFFHKSCIEHWLLSREAHHPVRTCPTCKQQVCVGTEFDGSKQGALWEFEVRSEWNLAGTEFAVSHLASQVSKKMISGTRFECFLMKCIAHQFDSRAPHRHEALAMLLRFHNHEHMQDAGLDVAADEQMVVELDAPLPSGGYANGCCTLLEIAILERHVKLLDACLSWGASTLRHGEHMMTPLMLATRELELLERIFPVYHKELVRKAQVDKCNDVVPVDYEGNSAFEHACWGRYTQTDGGRLIERFLDWTRETQRYAEVDHCNDEGENGSMYVLARGNIDLFLQIVAHRLCNKNMHAFLQSQTDPILVHFQNCFAHGRIKKVNARELGSALTVCADALDRSGASSYEVREMIAEIESRVCPTNHRKETALHMAVSRWTCDALIKKILGWMTLEERNRADTKGRTALHRLVLQIPPRMDLVQILLDFGVDPNAKDVHGCTPLHYAEDKKMTRMLYEAGAVAQPDRYGRWPGAEIKKSPRCRLIY